jgi:hypothetical protein
MKRRLLRFVDRRATKIAAQEPSRSHRLVQEVVDDLRRGARPLGFAMVTTV